MLRSACLFAFLALAPRAYAADVLFVADSDGDEELADVLMADGHRVTRVTGDFSGGRNTRLAMPIGDFDVVVWSADGMGNGSEHTDAVVFASLNMFVTQGGRVLVTGYDAVASPFDPMLVTFLGGTNSRDTPGAPGAVLDVENSLTVGYEDLRETTPPNPGNTDCITGLSADTTSVVASATDEECHQWTLRTLGRGEIAFVSSGGLAGMWSAGAYNIVVRNFVGSADTAVTEPGAPAITLEGPVSADEGEPVRLDASITDAEGDSFTYSWDLDGDGEFGELAGAPSYTLPAGRTDGPAGLRVGVEAIDAAGHRATLHRLVRITNAAPRIRSRAPRAATADETFAYRLLASDPAGAADPLAYALVEGPETMTVSADGVVSWMPSRLELTPEGDPGVAVEVSVQDDDGGSATQRWELVVTLNHIPTDPIPTYPIDRVALLETMPRLVVTNASDEDLDPLTYFFELDVVESFDSAARLESGPVGQTPGFSFWYVSQPLERDRPYYWRVWATDGENESQTREATFWVVRDPSERVDAGVDAGPAPDAGPIAVDAGTTPPPAGCGCHVGPVASSPLLFLPLFFARRRRR